MSVGSRLRAKLRREVRVWGLRAPARVSCTGGALHLQLEDERDEDLVEGFAVAAAAMLAMDLQRRLWSGRLGEVLGARPLADGVTVGDLDAFTRLLGFRAEAEQRFKALAAGPKRSCEDYARGVNAWIDADSWSRDPRWAAVGTRPRLWGAADCVLLAGAPGTVDAVGPTFHVEPEVVRTEASERSLRALWGALHDDSLRAPDAVGGGADLEPTGPAGVPSRLALDTSPPRAAALVPLTQDRHRRLRARAQNIDLGGPTPRRLTVRRGPEGAVVSDLFNDDGGPGYLWRWGGDGSPVAPAAARLRLADGSPWRLADLSPQEVPITRLVPLEGGA
jgi:hypothetical protein